MEKELTAEQAQVAHDAARRGQELLLDRVLIALGITAKLKAGIPAETTTPVAKIAEAPTKLAA